MVEMRKHLLAQTKARLKNGSGEPFAAMDGELKTLLGVQIADLEARIEAATIANPDMAGTARILRLIKGGRPGDKLDADCRTTRDRPNIKRTGRCDDRACADRA